MGIAFIPLYIKFMGIEAYGLVGFFALLQASLSILDMGMAPTLGREMAKRSVKDHETKTIKDLLRTIEIIVLTLAILIILTIGVGAEWLATSWINSVAMPNNDVAFAISLMGLVIASRLVETIYKSSINGLQKQVMLNVINSLMATIRGAGAVIILAYISPTIFAFILWQGFISIITVIVLAIATYRSLPFSCHKAKFSWIELWNIRKFAGGVLGISILSLLITQIDKVILSKMLSLEEFGYYTLASLLAVSLFMLVSPITKAWFPVLTQLKAVDNQAGLALKFHQGAQIVSVVAGSASLVLIFQGETFLRLWTQDDVLSSNVAPVLRLLAFGYLLNMMVWIPFETQMAHAAVSLPVKTNLVAVVFMVPAVTVLTYYFGAIGAAMAWVLLNLGYILISVQLMFRTILPNEKWRWYFEDIIIPLLPAASVLFLLEAFFDNTRGAGQQFITLLACAILSLLISSFFASHVREYLVIFLKLNKKFNL